MGEQNIGNGGQKGDLQPGQGPDVDQETDEAQGLDVFEVFSQRTHSSDFMHQFSLLAPNHQMALLMAKENFLRREPFVNIWVVRRSDIYKPSAEERQAFATLDNKSYRETKGYGYLKEKWRQYKQEAFTEHKLTDHVKKG